MRQSTLGQTMLCRDMFLCETMPCRSSCIILYGAKSQVPCGPTPEDRLAICLCEVRKGVERQQAVRSQDSVSVKQALYKLFPEE